MAEVQLSGDVQPEDQSQPRPCVGALAPECEADRRVPITPDSAKALKEMGWHVQVPKGLGNRCGYTDSQYESSGADVQRSSQALLDHANVVLCVSLPSQAVISKMPKGLILAGFLDPFSQPSRIKELAERGVSSLALELVPRTTIAQSMDGLSSQASLAGYAAAVLAASKIAKALPMMSTPAGTIKPARVLVVGTGVAGLQAIATAVRLGARVLAYDIRPTAKEQVESLGAKFAKIELGETGETAGGYAKELTAGQIQSQRAQLTKLCAESDIIITTAQIFGKPAPRIITAEMVRAMKPGSVIVDAAMATGGNVEPAESGKEIDFEGVIVIGDPYLPSRVARDASQVLASNLASLLKHAIDPATKSLKEPSTDEILSGVLLTHEGAIRDQRIEAMVAHVPNGGAA